MAGLACSEPLRVKIWGIRVHPDDAEMMRHEAESLRRLDMTSRGFIERGRLRSNPETDGRLAIVDLLDRLGSQFLKEPK